MKLFFLSTLLFFCSPLNVQTQIPEVIFRKWHHSFEEDRKQIRHYRPEEYDFPLSRSREAIEFKKDGTYIEYRTGPDDRHIQHEGEWKAGHCGEIKIKLKKPKQEFSLMLVSASDTLLKLRPIEKKK
ncbi:MAG: hypothetical protein ACK4ND_08105 [Cytophagaceae bacterium]